MLVVKAKSIKIKRYQNDVHGVIAAPVKSHGYDEWSSLWFTGCSNFPARACYQSFSLRVLMIDGYFFVGREVMASELFSYCVRFW